MGSKNSTQVLSFQGKHFTGWALSSTLAMPWNHVFYAMTQSVRGSRNPRSRLAVETRWQKRTWWPMCFLFLCPAEGVSPGRTLWCGQANRARSRELWGRGRNYKSQVSFPFVIIIHVRSPVGKSSSALKHAREEGEERLTRVRPTKRLFEPPLSSSIKFSPVLSTKMESGFKVEWQASSWRNSIPWTHL